MGTSFLREYLADTDPPLGKMPIFTALHGMQRGLNDEISVRLSVCLSGCQTRAL